MVRPASAGTPRRYRILFQGDSITDGNRSRDDDLNHVMGHGYAYLIAARLGCDHPTRGLDFVNRGVSANTVDDLVARWDDDTVALSPDLVSVLVGVNDVARLVRGAGATSVDGVEAGCRKLLRRTRDRLPGARLVLCEPFLLPVGEPGEHWSAWSGAMARVQAVVAVLATEFGAVHVPLQDTFDAASAQAPAEHWAWDGIHPTPAGHELIARRWVEVVNPAPESLPRSVV